jgi:hypothetical protein
MKKIILVISALLNFSGLFATEQIPDKIIIERDTFDIVNSYPDHIEFNRQLTEKISEINESWSTTCCNRGYIATWKIIENKIYLIDIINYRNKADIKHLVEQLLGKNFIDGKLEVPNINEEFYCGLNPIWSGSLRKMSEKEYKIKINNGIVIKKQLFVYNNCKYKNESLLKYIYNQINWSGIQGKHFLVRITAIMDTTGKIISCKKGDEYFYDANIYNQLNNILLKMPCMQVYVREGVFQPEVNFTLDFNDKIKEKYVR